MKKDKGQNINVKGARHMPKCEDKRILSIYRRIDRELRNIRDSNIWKEVVNSVVSVS
jgi:hypothetical protein